MPKPYAVETHCIKCGETNASTQYCQGTTSKEKVANCETAGEHLHRQCARCGYGWIEEPLDKL